MAKIKFNIKIKDIVFDSYIVLEGQQLYFFGKRDEEGKAEWIKSHLESRMEINNIIEE